MVKAARGAVKSTFAEPESGGAKITRDISEFAANFIPLMKGTEGLKAFGAVAAYGRPVIASAIAAYQKVDPMEGNLANVAQHFGVDKGALSKMLHVDDLIGALAVDATDTEFAARLKNMAADGVAGVATDGAFKALGSMVGIVRRAKVEKAELLALKAAHENPIDVNVESIKAALDEGPAPTLAARAEVGPSLVKPEAPVGTQGDLFGAAPSTAPSHLDDFERVFMDVDAKVKGMSPDALRQLADDQATGKGFTMLERMGVNPARLDFGAFLAKHTDPATAMEALHDWVARIATAAEPMSLQMGSAPRTANATATLARMLGSDVASVVKTFSDKTKNLDVFANAASGLIGGEAQKLVVMAEKAMPRFRDAGSPEYIDFLKQLETVASLQAAFRGSASRMGRGLRSLQNIVGARSGSAKVGRLKSVLGKDPQDIVAKAGRSFEDKLTALGEAKSPQAREKLLRAILESRGDLGAVIKQAGRFQGLTGKIVILRETTANLFSPGTFTFNVLGGVTMAAGDIIAASTSHLGAAVFRTAEWRAASAAHQAYLGTMLPALWHGVTRSTQYLAKELILEAKAATDGLGSTKAGPALTGAADWVEKQFGKIPIWEADKLGTGSTLGGLKPKFERPDMSRERLWHIPATAVDAMLTSNDHGPAFLQMGLRSLLGMSFNAFGAVTRSARILAIDVPDELIGQTVFNARRYSEAVRKATLDGIEIGKSGKDLAEYAERNALVLSKESSNESLERIEQLIAGGSHDEEKIKLLAQEALDRTDIENIAADGARRILFQDEFHSAALKATSHWLNIVDSGGIVVPFVKTPLKIIENAAREFTPAGLFFRDTWETLSKGGPEAAELAAKITLGTMLIVEGYTGAASGALVGYDGGSNSSARNGRPQYSGRLPDGKHWEYGRLDPIAIPLGFGADLHYWEQQFDAEDKEQMASALEKHTYAVLHAVVSSVMSKTWLQSLKNFSAMFDTKTGDYSREQFYNGLLQRAVPAGGFQKYAVQGDEDAIKAAKTSAEKWQAGWVGLSSSLPDRRDTLLGQVVTPARTAGIKHSPRADDPLLDELGRLNFERPPETRSVGGAELDVHQRERLKAIMGEEVRFSGQTLSERLRSNLETSRWKGMSDYQRTEEVRKTRSQYADMAKVLLQKEDQKLAGEVKVQRHIGLLEKRGVSAEELPAAVRQFRREVLGVK